jgi:hypothetical protein
MRSIIRRWPAVHRPADEAVSALSEDFGHCHPTQLSVFGHSSQEVPRHPDGDNGASSAARAGLDVRPQLDILVWIHG